MEPPHDFPAEVRTMLEKAGWYEGRQAAGTFVLPSDVAYPPAVAQLLNEFGGLLVYSDGPGINVGRNSLDFDPSWAECESGPDGKLTYYASLIGSPLYPLAHIERESLLLCLDAQGRAYWVGDNMYWGGHSFAEGVSNVLLGVKGKTLDEDDGTWYD